MGQGDKSRLKHKEKMQTFWKIPPADLLLSEKEIHIWCAALDLPIINMQKVHELLSIDERVKAGRFHFGRDRKRFIIRYGILRKILGCYLDVDPSELRFCYGKNGKPRLAELFDNGMIHFNMSHSEGLALYGFSLDREIGVDIERFCEIPEIDKIVEQIFSRKEKDIFRSLPENEKKEAFFKCWTRKEAFVKAVGDGLSRSLDKFEVSVVPDEPTRLLRIEGDSKRGHQWSIQDLQPAPGFIGAFAVNGRSWQLYCWHWSDSFMEKIRI